MVWICDVFCTEVEVFLIPYLMKFNFPFLFLFLFLLLSGIWSSPGLQVKQHQIINLLCQVGDQTWVPGLQRQCRFCCVTARTPNFLNKYLSSLGSEYRLIILSAPSPTISSYIATYRHSSHHLWTNMSYLHSTGSSSTFLYACILYQKISISDRASVKRQWSPPVSVNPSMILPELIHHSLLCTLVPCTLATHRAKSSHSICAHLSSKHFLSLISQILFFSF